MSFAPVDPSVARQAADQNDMVQRKIQIDNLKKTLNGEPDKDKKLREACEGFEAVFIQKIWQEMRKNVPKEGYLHSKEEDAYLGMFDEEFSKKMSSAGGIGLADMLYEQLNQRLDQGSRGTTTRDAGGAGRASVISAGSSPSNARFGMTGGAAAGATGEAAGAAAGAQNAAALNPVKNPAAEKAADIYSELPEEGQGETARTQALEQAETGEEGALEGKLSDTERAVLHRALNELKDDLGPEEAAEGELGEAQAGDLIRAAMNGSDDEAQAHADGLAGAQAGARAMDPDPAFNQLNGYAAGPQVAAQSPGQHGAAAARPAGRDETRGEWLLPNQVSAPGKTTPSNSVSPFKVSGKVSGRTIQSRLGRVGGQPQAAQTPEQTGQLDGRTPDPSVDQVNAPAAGPAQARQNSAVLNHPGRLGRSSNS